MTLLVHFLSASLHSVLPGHNFTREDSSFQKLHRFSNREVYVADGNRKRKAPLHCREEYLKLQDMAFQSSLALWESEWDWSDTVCIRLAKISDSSRSSHLLVESQECKSKGGKNCVHGPYTLMVSGWSSLKPYHGCISRSAEYTGGADFALNLNDSLALAVMVTAIAGGKHLGNHFLDSIPDDLDPIYTAQIATSRMLCAPGKTEPFHNSERKQFHFGTYPQFRLFRMGGKGILVMRGRDRQDPSRNRVIETTIDLYGMLQSREYFDKTLPDGKRFPYADYGVKDGILYRKILDPHSTNATFMDQGWVGLWVDRLLVPDYLRADSAARAQEDSLERTKNQSKARP